MQDEAEKFLEDRVSTTRVSADPAVVSIAMGYGHLRAAYPLADVLNTEVLDVDRPPLASQRDTSLWDGTRHFYEVISRVSQVPLVGAPLRALLNRITDIPNLHPYRDLSAPHPGAHLLRWNIERGLGEGLVDYLQTQRVPLLTTFYSPALIADFHHYEPTYCVVTDTDLNRVWVSRDPSQSHIQYLVPSRRAQRRLLSYGVRQERVHFTGFPLPPELLGGSNLDTLKENLAARLVRLDPAGRFRKWARDELAHFLGPLPEEAQKSQPPTLMYAVGGAGAQADLVEQFLPRMRDAILKGDLRVVLVAGVRSEVANYFESLINQFDLGDALRPGCTSADDSSSPDAVPLEILHEPTFEAYYRRFNTTLAHTDVLWTKPSEMTFYAALGIPLVFSWPVGVHERYNRRWATESGAGSKQRDPHLAFDWLSELLVDGTLAAQAWSGFMRLPKFGTYRIAEIVGEHSLNK